MRKFMRGPDASTAAGGFARVASALVAAGLTARAIFAARQALDGGGADYVAFASGARVLSTGSRCLYCLKDQTAAQIAVLGYRPQPLSASFPAPYANPPLAAWVLQPLAHLPLALGLRLFELLLLLALGVLVACMWRLLRPRRLPVAPRIALVALAAGSLPGATAVLLGQWDPLIAAALAAAIWATRTQREATAGVLASVIFIKPQLGILLAIAVVLTARRRFIAGFAAGLVTWILTSVLIVGPAGIGQWASYVTARLAGQAVYARGLAGLGATAGGDAQVVEWTAAAIGVALALIGFLCRQSFRGRPDVAIAVGVGASLCASPHVFSSDMLLLAPALVLWGTRSIWPALGGALALNVAFAVDEYLLPGRFQRVEGVVALVIVGALLQAVGRAEEPPPGRSGEGVATASRPGAPQWRARRVTTFPPSLRRPQ